LSNHITLQHLSLKKKMILVYPLNGMSCFKTVHCTLNVLKQEIFTYGPLKVQLAQTIHFI